MTSTAFRQVGPYVIERAIGQGGMASVFLATDSRTGTEVALKLVHAGSDAEAREILDSEQRGAELQKRFSAVSQFVPKVYESGFATDHFFIAMEYIAGEDLSQAIHRGPIGERRAVAIAIQLCRFLEEADRFETTAASRRILLHNDLKPRNVRLMAGDEIRVLDFGAAKALSVSRRVTRNDFGSTAYLSPECLDSGERDRHSDAWALGVLLYEMVRGRQPFRAEDTRRLEARIRSRTPPEAIEQHCSRPLQAVVAKLLAPYPGERYGDPADIRADLERVRAGEPTHAEADGWPSRAADEPPTRRTHDPVLSEPPTRPAARPSPTPTAGATTVIPPAPATPVLVVRPHSRLRRWLLRGAIVIAASLALNESCVAIHANNLANVVPLQEFDGLTNIWTDYESLAGRSGLGGLGVGGLERALRRQTMILAERVIGNYRTPAPTVRENQWKAARDGLRRALAISSGDLEMRAALSYCEGHLHRIDGEARKARGQVTQAQHEFTAAVTAFREAANLRRNWPDPFLGLARTFIYGLDDVDRGAEALDQAQKFGHVLTDRETTQLADGHRVRGETLLRTAQRLGGMPQERDYLLRAAESFRQALAHYSKVPEFANVAASIRATQSRLDQVERRLAGAIPVIEKTPWE